MYQKFSLILAVIFFFNSLPLPAAAQAVRSSRNDRRQRAARQAQFEANLEARVNQTQYPYDSWKIEQTELRTLLQEPDLSVLEKKFIELELQNLQAHINHVDDLTETNMSFYNAVNQQYSSWFAAIDEQKQALEKIAALRNFYQEAQSDHFIAAAVYALHQQKPVSIPAQPQDVRTSSQREQLLREQLVQPTDALRVDVPPSVLADANKTLGTASPLLSQWSENKLSLEDVVEYMDPVDGYLDQVTPDAIAQAATILFSQFHRYNSEPDLDWQIRDNAVWLARRLKYRVRHQLFEAEQKAQASTTGAVYWVQARGNLMLLAIQVDNFLRTFDATGDQSERARHDMQLEEYRVLRKDLSAYKNGVWPFKNVGDSITRELKAIYASGIRQDSENFTLFSSQLSYAVRFLIDTGKLRNVSDLVVMVNTDRDSFHGKNEAFVSAIFAGIFETFMQDPLSSETQQGLRQLLLCAAAPKCTYNGTEKTNAVNVRTQALAVASMLRQIAKSGTLRTDQGETPTEIASLNKDLFNDERFRTAMAAYTVDIYWPTQAWNVSKNNITRYDLKLDELKNFANYLASMYETFLPVKEPKTTIKKITSGIYEGCAIREVDTRNLVYRNNLNLTRGSSITQATSTQGYPCKENPQVKNVLYGGFNELVVTDSKGYLHAITALNKFNRDRAIKDFVNSFFLEVATWYLWGAAWKGLSYGWKALRATALASKTALQANNGMRLMRFNSKFAQVWKYSTNGWQTEMGLTNITKNADKLVVEMHRPGYQGYVFEFGEDVLQGHSLKSLQGRLLLRRAVQRRIYAQYGAVPVSEATAQGVTTSTQVARRTLSNELADELARPLTQVEQATVRQEKTIVDAVKQELAEGTSFEAVPATTGDPVVLYRPIKRPELHIDLNTGLPEQAILDPLTGNVTGQFSRQYAGTVVTPYFQNQAAYNIAAGLTSSPSTSFMPHVLANEFPLFGQLKGLSKFVFTLTALDQPVYYLYTKPYLNNFATKQHQDLSRQTGLKEEEAKPLPQNILGQIQGLRTSMEETTGAAMMGAFYGFNQLLNLVLPSWVTQARQSLFTATTHAIQSIDGPLSDALVNATGSNKLANIFPMPAQVLSLPFVLAGDPTPSYSEAVRAQYQQATLRQALSHAVEQQNITQFKQQLDKIFQNIDKMLSTAKQTYAFFLDANSEQQLAQIFSDYGEALQQVKSLTDTDLKKAADLFEQAEKALVDGEMNIIVPRIQLVQDANNEVLIQRVHTTWMQRYGAKVFDQTMQDRLAQIIRTHSDNIKRLYPQYIQAVSIAKKTEKTPQEVYNEITQELRQSKNNQDTQLQDLEIALYFQQKIHSADQVIGTSLAFNQLYLQENDDAQLKRYAQVYKQNLRNLLAHLPKEISELEDRLTQEGLTFHNSYVELLSQRITDWYDKKLKEKITQKKTHFSEFFGLVLQDSDLQSLEEILTQLNQWKKEKSIETAAIYRTAFQSQTTLSDVMLDIDDKYSFIIGIGENAVQSLENQLYNRLTGQLRTAQPTQRTIVLMALMKYDTRTLYSDIMEMEQQKWPAGYKNDVAQQKWEARHQREIDQLKLARRDIEANYSLTLNHLLSQAVSGNELYEGYLEAARHLKASWQQTRAAILFQKTEEYDEVETEGTAQPE